MLAWVRMEAEDGFRLRSGFKFIDCIATWVTKDDPPAGYGRPPEQDKYGMMREPSLSYVAGLVGGGLDCVLYPAQFAIPGLWGVPVHFHAGPKEILDACVQSLREERQAPEYHL